MRKGRDGGKKRGGKKREKKENTDENSDHYVIASSRPPERRPLERRTLAPITVYETLIKKKNSFMNVEIQDQIQNFKIKFYF